MKVAIIGGGAKEHNFFPPECSVPDDVEVWGLNAIRREWVPRWDRMFNLHVYERLVDYGYDIERDSKWSHKNPTVPFYVCDPWPDGFLPGQEIFPREEMAKAMPRGDYHCGSFDWLVAFAVFLGADEVNLFGVGLCLEAGEPLSARACLEYWCGYAEGRGVKVTTAKDCDIFYFYHLVKSNLVYSYDDTPIYEDRTKDAVAGAPYQV